MKFSTFALSLGAFAASLATALPAVEEHDKRILCIGCITDSSFCLEKSKPSNCNAEGNDPNSCEEFCVYTSASGCRCCYNKDPLGEDDCWDAN